MLVDDNIKIVPEKKGWDVLEWIILGQDIK
jgi:hypothetical protein